MRIYLAARYARHQEMRQYARELITLGHTVTSRWILGDHDIRSHGESESATYMALWAAEDWDGVLAADVVISFTEAPGDVPGRSRGGRHTEFGIALTLGKRCVVIHYRENVFHWLPQVEFYSTWDAFVAALQSEVLDDFVAC